MMVPRIIRYVLLLNILLILFPVFCQAQNQETQIGQPVIVPPGTSGHRIFGDFLIDYSIDSTGSFAICTLYVATQFVGVRALVAESPNYNFDVALGYGWAKGLINLNLGNNQYPMNLSTLSGDFQYSGNNQQFTFKGDLISWFKPIK